MSDEFLLPDESFFAEEEEIRSAEELPELPKELRGQVLGAAARAYRRGQYLRGIQVTTVAATLFMAAVFLAGYYVSLLSGRAESMAAMARARASTFVRRPAGPEVSPRDELLASFAQPDVWASVEASQAFREYGLQTIRHAFMD